MVITQLHIKVTYDLTARRPEITGDVPIVKQCTPVDQTYYDIPANQTTLLYDGVKSCGPAYEERINKSEETVVITRDNYKIEVGNAICK